MMPNPVLIGLIVFAVIVAGTFAGWAMRRRLPANHLTDETKSLVSLSMAIVATLSALVLGLLISNANSSFTALGGEVTTLSAQLIRLDQVLRRYGPETKQTRELLRQYVEAKTADLFPDDRAEVRIGNPLTYELLQQVEDSLLALKPANSRDQWWLGQALTLAGKIGDARWLLAQRVGQGTPKAFMVVLVFWLTLLFASFGLFAPPNLTSTATLTVCALAVAAAVTMILELENGLGPYLTRTDAAGRDNIASRSAQRDSRPALLTILPMNRSGMRSPPVGAMLPYSFGLQQMTSAARYRTTPSLIAKWASLNTFSGTP